MVSHFLRLAIHQKGAALWLSSGRMRLTVSVFAHVAQRQPVINPAAHKHRAPRTCAFKLKTPTRRGEIVSHVQHQLSETRKHLAGENATFSGQVDKPTAKAENYSIVLQRRQRGRFKWNQTNALHLLHMLSAQQVNFASDIQITQSITLFVVIVDAHLRRSRVNPQPRTASSSCVLMIMRQRRA